MIEVRPPQPDDRRDQFISVQFQSDPKAAWTSGAVELLNYRSWNDGRMSSCGDWLQNCQHTPWRASG